MRLGSVCSGVGGMDMGLEAAGFKPAWFCEKDAQCRSVLQHHWPGVAIYDDLEGLADRDLPRVGLLAGGTPCQDLSVAGRRAGLDGERSGLFFEFIRLADALAPDWILWENVDGALSSQRGEDFAVCLEGFTGFRPAVPEEGWRSAGVCVGPLRWCVWRVLDAQYFGVAQRRRRVFVVAGTGAQPRPEVLLEPESVSGDSAPRRAPGEGVTPVLEVGARTASGGEGRNGSGIGEPGDPMFTLQAGKQHGIMPEVANPIVAVDLGAVLALQTDATPKWGELGFTLKQPSCSGGGQPAAALVGVVPRRLTPRECERLQGWPDDWTLVNGMKDSPRYRMIGNGVVSNVSAWIGRRIMREARSVLEEA